MGTVGPLQSSLAPAKHAWPWKSHTFLDTLNPWLHLSIELGTLKTIAGTFLARGSKKVPKKYRFLIRKMIFFVKTPWCQ